MRMNPSVMQHSVLVMFWWSIMLQRTCSYLAVLMQICYFLSVWCGDQLTIKLPAPISVFNLKMLYINPQKINTNILMGD